MDTLTTLSEFIPYSFLIIIAVLFSSIIIWAILRTIFKDKRLQGFAGIIDVLAMPGVMLHEAAHYIFCVATGVTVREVKFFTMSTPGALGYVSHDEVESFLASILIALGPIILNGFVVSLILYFLPNLHEAIKYYLIFAFTIGARPSNADLKNMFLPFSINRNRCFYELFAIIISFVPAWFIATWNVYSVYEINWFLFELSYFIFLGFLAGCYTIRQV